MVLAAVSDEAAVASWFRFSMTVFICSSTCNRTNTRVYTLGNYPQYAATPPLVIIVSVKPGVPDFEARERERESATPLLKAVVG